MAVSVAREEDSANRDTDNEPMDEPVFTCHHWGAVDGSERADRVSQNAKWVNWWTKR